MAIGEFDGTADYWKNVQMIGIDLGAKPSETFIWRREGMKPIEPFPAPAMTATEVGGVTKEILDRLSDKFTVGVSTASPAFPQPSAPMKTRPSTHVGTALRDSNGDLKPRPPVGTPPEPSPLPPNLFTRMEWNRGARVAGAAHFVEGLD